jgi:hypothetical protein
VTRRAFDLRDVFAVVRFVCDVEADRCVLEDVAVAREAWVVVALDGVAAITARGIPIPTVIRAAVENTAAACNKHRIRAITPHPPGHPDPEFAEVYVQLKTHSTSKSCDAFLRFCQSAGTGAGELA